MKDKKDLGPRFLKSILGKSPPPPFDKTPEGSIEIPSQYTIGYRAGIEAAAKLANDCVPHCPTNCAMHIRDRIRALAPAATTEKP